MTNNFTPTQNAILTVLSDGVPHHRQELMDCIDDPEPSSNQFHQALFRLRQRLKPLGQNIIVTLLNRRIAYVWTRRINSSDE